MLDSASLADAFAANWPIWLVTVTLVVAAVIDGLQLKVPNWLTFPMIVSGWVFSSTAGATMYGFAWYEALGFSLLGTVVGLLLLLPAYAIGGMGAGDVKLMAGIGAWVWTEHTLYAFAASAIVGGVIAVVMVLASKGWDKHQAQFWMILGEIMNNKNPEVLAAIAKERKPRMMLLPYGIPMAIGTIGYFALSGMIV
ncbi:Type IV leader peptidase family protein [Pirellulimonas nuda]|uniref:Type IV leader peptidase family protein n=1 Tax=Pirellulimonas nuda TaxID=2528009 RepID=A0A518DF51_9BACT|nr:prepilin peptidase [Pirellulimonas nuda]QDU90109.1 Type IV leader peptidase family protein [Pirellulimonas nuda]